MSDELIIGFWLFTDKMYKVHVCNAREGINKNIKILMQFLEKSEKIKYLGNGWVTEQKGSKTLRITLTEHNFQICLFFLLVFGHPVNVQSTYG